MKRHLLTLTAISALALTGCAPATTQSQAEPAQTTATQVKTTTTPAPTATTAAPKTSSTAVTTPKATKSTSALKTKFSGTTASGEEVTFEILPQRAQDYLNKAVKGTGLKGSWATLCSKTLTRDQLTSYTIITAENNGAGHTHTWVDFKIDLEAASSSPDPTTLQNIAEYAEGNATSNGTCSTFHSYLTSAGEQSYPEATIGVTLNGELTDSVTLK